MRNLASLLILATLIVTSSPTVIGIAKWFGLNFGAACIVGTVVTVLYVGLALGFERARR